MSDAAMAQHVLARRLVIPDDVVIESRDDTHAVLVNLATATRIRLSATAFAFVAAFNRPRRVGDVVPADRVALIEGPLRTLAAKHMLVDVDAPSDIARLRDGVAYRFCGAPAHVATGTTDFVVVGIPYDLAGCSDCRSAPALIRQKSLDYVYRVAIEDGRSRGWFDAGQGGWILRGATIADAGDVHIDYGESQRRTFARVARVLGNCLDDRAIPVILGGDRSVTHAALGGSTDRPPVTVVQITADAGRSTREGAGERLLSLPAVDRLVMLSPGIGDAEGMVGAHAHPAVYLSIDLAGIATGSARSAADKAGRLGAIKAQIARIGAASRIVGIDLVGLDAGGSSPTLGAITGCHLALAAMSAAYDR